MFFLVHVRMNVVTQDDRLKRKATTEIYYYIRYTILNMVSDSCFHHM